MKSELYICRAIQKDSPLTFSLIHIPKRTRTLNATLLGTKKLLPWFTLEFTMARPHSRSHVADRTESQASLGHKEDTSAPESQPFQRSIHYCV